LRAIAAGPAGVRRFVADAPGTGTVLLAAPPGVPLDPRFGVGSAEAHEASGALPLAGDWPTLRRDVDTATDLAAAARLGLGPRTAGLAARASRRAAPAQPPGPTGPRPGPRVTGSTGVTGSTAGRAG
ncbi:2-phospho-L-lactate guanylyltransferase, partial [Micromonospora sp. KC207]